MYVNKIFRCLAHSLGSLSPRRRIIEGLSLLPLIIPEKRDHIDAADLKVKLRQKGIQVGTINVRLAQLCLRYGLSLLSADKDFSHIAKHAPLVLIAD